MVQFVQYSHLIESILQNTKQLQHAQFYFVVSAFENYGPGKPRQ
jgi:hypothetical protein